MWWLINTAWARHSLPRAFVICLWGATALAPPAFAQGAGLHPPAAVAAGSPLSLDTTGAGEGTFYLVGPGHSAKRQIQLGQAIEVQPRELREAGRYLAIICTPTCRSATFYVTPADAATLSFMVHPSRAAVSQQDVVSAVAFPSDKFYNLLLSPGAVDFRMTAGGTVLMSRVVPTQYGMAWFRASSGSRAGAVQLVAAVDGLSARRIVQQVASDPCNLRITAQQTPRGITVETAPVRDCAGNPVPDGTIVSFTRVDAGGQSTVDAPVKEGIARAQLTGSGPAVIHVASGLVMGNQLRLGGQP